MNGMRDRDVAAAARAAGLAHLHDLVRGGLTEAAVAARIRTGVWWRPLPRVVALTTSRRLSTDQRRLAALLWLPPCAVLSHHDAAALWDLRTPAPYEVHLAVARRHMPRPQRGYIVHRVDSLGTHDIARRGGLPVTSLERTVVDLHDVLPAASDRAALVAQVFQTRRTTAARLVAAADRTPKLHHRDDLLRTIDLASAGAHSIGEMDAYRWLVGCGFPPPERQFPTMVAGRLRYLDAADPVLRIAYEVDGLHHADLPQRDADNDRDVELAAEGWETVRLTTFRLRRDAVRLRAAIARLREQRQAMADAGLLVPAQRVDVA
jgi:hypothetical protein